MNRGFRLQVETLDGRDLPDANPAAMMTAPIPADVVLAQAPPNNLPPSITGPVPLLPPPVLPPLLLPPEPIPIQPVMPVAPPPIVKLLPARPLEPALPPLLGPPAPVNPNQDLPPTPMPQRGLPVQPEQQPQILVPQGPLPVVPQGPVNPETLFPGPYARNPYETIPNPFLPGTPDYNQYSGTLRPQDGGPTFIPTTPDYNQYVGGPTVFDPFDWWHVNSDGNWSYTWPVTPVNPTP